jgi:spore coat protein CotH
LLKKSSVARRVRLWGVGIAATALAACGGGGTTTPVGVDGGQPISSGCSDLFDPSTVRTYSVDIDPAEWQSMDAEFHNLDALLTGLPFVAYHPIVFHMDGETVGNAVIKLHGQ